MKQSTGKMLLEIIRQLKGALTVLERYVRVESGLYIPVKLGEAADGKSDGS